MPSKTELLQEKQYRRWRGKSPSDFDACLRFLTEAVYIQHPEKGAILFDLREAQIEALATFMSKRYVIILKARQIGWSTLCAAYVLWLTMFWPDQTVVMLSRNEREAQKLLAKSDYAWKRLPEWLTQARGPKRLDRTVMKMSFSNGSSIESMPSRDDPARGSAVSLIVVDEWAFFENEEEAWASIEPVTDVGGRVIGLSTANGAGTFYETFWNRAVSGTSVFTPLFYPWWANSDRDEAWYEVKKANMLPWQLAQEYPENPEEAFIRSGNPVFDTDMLRAMETRPGLTGYLDDTFQGSKRAPAFVHIMDDAQAYREWAKPTPGYAYVIGADVAEGLEHGDYSCAQVLCLQTNELVATWHARIDPDLFADHLARLGWYWNVALVGVEVNNHGLTTNKGLQRLEYPRIYKRREVDGKDRWNNEQSKIGWLTSKTTKPLAIDELQQSLRQGLRIYDQPTIGELLTYKRDEKGSMSGSPFDDRVMALAIANQMLKYVRADDYVQPEDHYWTFNYFMEKAMKDGQASRKRVPIGAFNVR